MPSERQSNVAAVAGLIAAVERVFAEGGPLAAALEDYEPRLAQQRMAVEVARSFETCSDLLAEAGTGTGKTLAYLVPAILCGRRVLVSTGTKNLQEQIFFKDVPILRRALGVNFKVTYMKGRANYLCLHRYQQLRDDPAVAGLDRDFLSLIEDWAVQTSTGDRAEIEDVPEDSPLWGQVAAAAETCLGGECPRHAECFVTRMRQRAAESDLVIVNHHLLCADASVRESGYAEVIPGCAFAIIDEAHQLEDVATQYFGLSVSNHRLDELVNDAGRLVGTKVPADRRAAVGRTVQEVQDAARAFFSTLQSLRQPAAADASGGDERERIRPADLDPAAEAGESLMFALEAFAKTVDQVPDPGEDLAAIARRTREIRDQLRFLIEARDSDYVFFLEQRRRAVLLRAAPIDVSTVVRDAILGPMQATVLTSATLSVAGSFSYIRRRLGITGRREISLPSEFDFERQALLYLPARMPDPRSALFAEAAAREVAALLDLSRGRAFVLFTSHAMMRRVCALVEPSLRYPLFIQGEAPRSVVLRQFRSTANAVLFATSSFWQGVDVVGEALSSVIVDKLPFASPADPIVAARMEAIASEGGDAFNEYQVPLAVLTLLQGLGRLLRHRKDRGLLAVLDPRLRTKAYGQRFLAALPPAPVTHDLADVGRFFVCGSAENHLGEGTCAEGDRFGVN
ncbi:MAG: ATP-dependent DNA helicase [Vicinamibacterales bacterium]